MALKEELKNTGNWLFKWRSYIPLFMIGLFLLAFRDFDYPGGQHQLDEIWELICFIISLAGLGIRMFTGGCVPSGTSGRNTKKQVANVLNTTGMYSIVRHPLYLGNFFIYLGISLFLRLWWFPILVLSFFWFHYERLMYAEEDFLHEKFGDQFVTWAGKTPLFIPNFRNWVRPSLQYSWKISVKKEYSTFFAIISTYTGLDIIGDYFIYKEIILDYFWTSLFILSLIIYIIIRYFKKCTSILEIAGR